VVAQVKPGYLRDLIPGELSDERSAGSQVILCFTLESAPQKGDEWVSIVDDYQKFIVPGMASTFYMHCFFCESNWRHQD
jgi:hypothetical protein